MYSTVVCDEYGVCLGLVYSSKESIRAAFLERKGIYWSRSRDSLWRKGDTSGMFQELLHMTYDCDRDALQFIVIQHGNPAAFCHLMRRTCWGPENGVRKLESMLKERKISAPEGSYTKRLFNDSDLLRKKLLEEVQEVVEAEEPDHVAAEAADVMYFLMTRCVAAGVGLRDIEKHLDKRSFKVTDIRNTLNSYLSTLHGFSLCELISSCTLHTLVLHTYICTYVRIYFFSGITTYFF
mmetsp:Transcript_5252/g.8507  ORF Transcript_5252/g.8507 Transcript_5252/m.8507 type:complete len:237 (+) Transcript_5252:937-1647(+)